MQRNGNSADSGTEHTPNSPNTVFFSRPLWDLHAEYGILFRFRFPHLDFSRRHLIDQFLFYFTFIFITVHSKGSDRLAPKFISSWDIPTYHRLLYRQRKLELFSFTNELLSAYNNSKISLPEIVAKFESI